MDRNERKAAVAAYKEAKAVAGIYALRCAATDERWVGRAPDVATIENRLRFTLRMGTTPHRSLQAAARSHGPGAFEFEIVERLDEKEAELGRDRLLKARHAHWCAALGATGI